MQLTLADLAIVPEMPKVALCSILQPCSWKWWMPKYTKMYAYQ